ncbi:magnesium transporter MRS2-1 isoform X1 [Daucus carota subsp. sativus]|uniref:magnesium transporter MRS2-1 isoform X1 n=2 Tax=Daucus carota subsp. sativus TaxID=79200 RepID=UPI0030833133
MADLKERFPPRRPASSKNSRDAACRTSARDQGLRSWIRVDASGESQVIEVDKLSMMRRCDLPARDLRLLDPSFVYPSTILGRDRAIVVNLEQIRCIITADEVFLFNSLDINVKQYVAELQRRLPTAGVGEVLQTESAELDQREGGNRSIENLYSNNSPHYLPFEFKALEVALEAACTFLDSKALELEISVNPLLDALTSKISTSNLERLRQIKRGLETLTKRVQKVRDEIEEVMDDADYMAKMYLTKRKSRMESTFYSDPSTPEYRFNDVAFSVSAPVTPVSSPPDRRKHEKSYSLARGRHESMGSSESATESVVALEMLLEAYFVVIDSTLNKLTSLREYIDDTEDLLNFQLLLIQFTVLLATASFVVALFGVVSDFETYMFQFRNSKFKWIMISTSVTGFVVFFSVLWFLKYIKKPFWMM